MQLVFNVDFLCCSVVKLKQVGFKARQKSLTSKQASKEGTQVYNIEARENEHGGTFWTR